MAVILYVRYPLPLRNVEDLLQERGIEISHENVRFWWNPFHPLFAAEIRERRVSGMRSRHGAKKATEPLQWLELTRTAAAIGCQS